MERGKVTLQALLPLFAVKSKTDLLRVGSYPSSERRTFGPSATDDAGHVPGAYRAVRRGRTAHADPRAQPRRAAPRRAAGPGTAGLAPRGDCRGGGPDLWAE
eukprot:scaffold30055_cov118-Isochrysis_galbana.AAC.6